VGDGSKCRQHGKGGNGDKLGRIHDDSLIKIG
jgi:hypothetical protein